MRNEIGWSLLVAGLVMVGLGVAWLAGAGAWLGRLPGDLRIETPHTRVFVPITTCLLASLAVSLAAWIFRQLVR